MSRIVYMMEGIDLDRGSNADLALDAAFGDFYLASWAQTVRLAGILTQDASVAEELAQEAFSQVLSRWSEGVGRLGRSVEIDADVVTRTW